MTSPYGPKMTTSKSSAESFSKRDFEWTSQYEAQDQNLSAVALLGPHVAGIGDGDNPIGRAQPQNRNLWLRHIKQRSGKKKDRILC